MRSIKQAKVYVGFITYGEATAKYLPYFLASLSTQHFENFYVLAVDNTKDADNENKRFVTENYPGVSWNRTGENIGFSQAYNLMIKRAIDAGAEYFIALNPDIILEPDAIEKLVEVMDDDSRLGSASPKVRRWDFSLVEKDFDASKTNYIDTVGIALKPGLRFIDIGQGKIDDGVYDEQPILGPSGAAAIYRISVLEKIENNGQFFDERMFMYKEDCDLDYRLFLAGFESMSVPSAIIYHDRTATASGENNISVALNRRQKSKQIKIWSFVHQWIIFKKYWHLQNSANKLEIIWFALKMFLYASVFESYLLKELKKMPKIEKYRV